MHQPECTYQGMENRCGRIVRNPGSLFLTLIYYFVDVCVHLCIIVFSVFIIVYFNIETKIKIDLLIKHTSSNGYIIFLKEQLTGCSPVWSAVVEHLISL